MKKSSSVTYEKVAAAAESLKNQGVEPSVSKVTDLLENGGSPNKVGPLLARWKVQPQQPQASQLAIEPEIIQLILRQINDECAKATAASLARAEAAEADSQVNAEVGSEALEMVEELESNLDAANAKIQQLIGQLNERTVEHEKDRKTASLAVVAAQERADNERQIAEVGRQELVRAKLLAEAIPCLEAELANQMQRLDECSKLLISEHCFVVEAREKLVSAVMRINDFEVRESKYAGHIQQLELELSSSRTVERRLNVQLQEMGRDLTKALTELEAVHGWELELRARHEERCMFESIKNAAPEETALLN